MKAFKTLSLITLVSVVLVGCGASGPASDAKLFAPETIAKFKDVAIDGFKLNFERTDNGGASLSYSSLEPNAHGLTTNMEVALVHCLGCPDMEVNEEWRSREDRERSLSGHENMQIETREEVMAGIPVISQYVVSYKDKGGRADRFNHLIVHSNDQVNKLQVRVQPGYSPEEGNSAEEMKQRFTREEMAAAAEKAVVAFKQYL